MKRAAVGILLACIITLTPGCAFSNVTPIERVMHISVAGLDWENGLVKLTIYTNFASTGESGKQGEVESGGEGTKIYTSYGESVFDANRNLHAYTGYDIFWGHLEYIVIGEELAANGINEQMDYFIRNHESRLSARPIIALGCTALDFITRTDDSTILLNQKLDSLFDDKGALSETTEVQLIDYDMMVDHAFDHVQYLPCVMMGEYSQKSQEESEIKDILLDGYGFLFDEKLVAVALGKTARGVSWIMNEIVSGVIVLEDPEGSRLSLEIIDSSVTIKPEFEDEIAKVTIQVKFSTNIVENTGAQDIIHEDAIALFEQKQSESIKREIEEAIALMQANKADIAGIGDAIYHQYPRKFKALMDNWPEVFATIPISVEIYSRINRTYTTIETEERDEDCQCCT